jgi:cytochrome c5
MTVMDHRQQVLALLVCGALMSAIAACASPGPSGAAGGGAPSAVDIDEIFPAGRGRDLVLNNCQTCHSFVPIVVLQMDKDAWQRNSLDHRQRVPGLSDEDYQVLYGYLASNFNPSRAVPTLPKELLESWTSY